MSTLEIPEILSMISLISFILAAISFVLAVFFWIRFNIPAVIGDLSGRTARKSIEKMRTNNEKTGKKDFTPSKTNLNRGKVTELMSESGKQSGKLSGKLSEKLSGKLKEEKPVVEEQLETGLLDENMQTAYESEETGLLSEVEQNETELLETGVLEPDATETELLAESEETGLLVDDNETMLLTEETKPEVKTSGNDVFTMIEEIMLIHTDEEI